jgi:hypothetical protein
MFVVFFFFFPVSYTEECYKDLDYIQDHPSWCGTTSSNVIAFDVVINPLVTHDLEILRKVFLEG